MAGSTKQENDENVRSLSWDRFSWHENCKILSSSDGPKRANISAVSRWCGRGGINSFADLWRRYLVMGGTPLHHTSVSHVMSFLSLFYLLESGTSQWGRAIVMGNIKKPFIPGWSANNTAILPAKHNFHQFSMTSYFTLSMLFDGNLSLQSHCCSLCVGLKSCIQNLVQESAEQKELRLVTEAMPPVDPSLDSFLLFTVRRWSSQENISNWHWVQGD